MSLDWVLPGNSTPTRSLFEELYQANNLKPPENFIECSSLVIMRGILMESDRVALLSKHQVYFELNENMLTTLPVNLENTMRPIGVTMRKHSEHSPAMKLFLDELRTVAREM